MDQGAGRSAFIVRRLRPWEIQRALNLCWETFLLYEAPVYGPEGVEEFRSSVVESRAFRFACQKGYNRMWGGFDRGFLCGVMAMRGESHLCLAFTHRDYLRRGVATAIFKRLLADVRRENPQVNAITLNASPCGLPFYRRMGFVETGPEQVSHGMIYTPMSRPLAAPVRAGPPGETADGKAAKR